MLKSHTAPKRLKEIEEWFKERVTQPLTVSMHNRPEVADLINNGPTLSAQGCLELYQQQYGWRLLRVLEDHFQMLLRLLGRERFNEKIAIPYLSAELASDYRLSHFGDTLTNWIQKNYCEKDRELVLPCSEMDWALQKALWETANTPLEQGTFSLEDMLYLQPHITLMKSPFHVLEFRKILFQLPDENWGRVHFEKKEHFSLIYRSLKNEVQIEEISHPEFQILSALQKGSNLIDALEHLDEDMQKNEEFISVWFFEWTKEGLISNKH